MKLQRFGKNKIVLFSRKLRTSIESNGSFIYCSYDQLKNFKLVLSKMGHVRVEELKIVRTLQSNAETNTSLILQYTA